MPGGRHAEQFRQPRGGRSGPNARSLCQTEKSVYWYTSLHPHRKRGLLVQSNANETVETGQDQVLNVLADRFGFAEFKPGQAE